MISVIVPVYNVKDYIIRTLNSILAQTYTDIEIIVVDDGSTDGTAGILDTFAEHHSDKIRAIHMPNGGVTNARLAGVQNANGDWIGFVDGDDIIEPDMYECLLENAQRYHVDISHCGYQMHFADGRVNYFYNTGRFMEQDKIKGLQDLLDGSFVEPGLWNKLFRKELFHTLLHDKVMDTSIRINEDLLMNFYLFSAANKSVFQDVCKYHYIVRDNSVSRQKINKNKIYDPIRVKQIILENCCHEIKIDAQKALLNTCIYSYCNLTLWKREFAEDREKIRQLIKKYYNVVSLMPKRTQIMAILIKKLPWMLQIMYPFYVNHIQMKKYE